jgi:hypothetical protein
VRRFLIISAVALAGALVAPIGAASEPPRATLSGFQCHQASNALDRWIAVTAVMRPVTGTEHMALKFQLLRKTAGSSGFVNVPGPPESDLGKWRYPPDPTLGQHPNDVWQKNKPVINLPAPAVYRFRVSFRWIGTAGSVLGTTVRLSPRCDQR